MTTEPRYLRNDCPTCGGPMLGVHYHEATDQDTTENEARKLGEEYGRNAGSWVVDGNTSDDELRAIIRMSDDCELDIPAPLSGEWADGLTLGRLADELGVDEESEEFDDLCGDFEDAYYQAYEDEAVRSARAMLPDEPGHDARPSPHGLAGGVFTTCAEPGCSVPVWREDSPGEGYTSLAEGTWKHVNQDTTEEGTS